MNGFIGLHRKIQDHWIWKDANKLKWWLDILLTVNSEPSNVNIGNDVIVCNRGESIMSLQNWADRWGVTKDTARNFLILLESSHMITRVNIVKSTRISVCNYDNYNTQLHVKPTVAVRGLATNNNILSKDSNIINRREDFKNDISQYLEKFGKETLNAFFKYWTEPNKSKTKMRFELEKTWDTSLRLSNWYNNKFKKTNNFSNDYSEVGN